MNMKHLIAAVLVSVGLVSGVNGKELQVQLNTLPFAVQKTIKAKAGQDKVVRVMRESQGGKDVYDAIVNKGGKQVAIQVDDTGHYLGTHDEAGGANKH